MITTERFSLFQLLFKKQHEFHLPSPFDARNHFPLVASEGDIFLIDIAVTRLQFFQQPALGYFSIPFDTGTAHIIRKNTNDQRITSQITEHTAQLTEVCSQNGITLCFCNTVGKPLPGKNFVTPPDIRPMLFLSMPTLESLDTLDRNTEPVRTCLYRILRPRRHTRKKDRDGKHRKPYCF